MWISRAYTKGERGVQHYEVSMNSVVYFCSARESTRYTSLAQQLSTADQYKNYRVFPSSI